MGRLFAAAIVFASLSAQLLTACARKPTEESDFQPAEAVSVSDVTVPSASLANGTVVLDVMISEEGEVRNVQVRRALVPVTEEAVRSVETWKFAPARLNGKAITSRVTVAVTFNPAPPLAENVPLPPLIHQDDEARIQSSYQPPQVTHATFPTYPVDAFNPGTVILQASINAAGKGQSAKVLRDAPPFTAKAIEAIQDWRFMPATLNGKSVESKVVLVFCFRLPHRPLPPIIHQDDEARIQSRYQPPQVTRATFPMYPDDAFNPGTVILQASINEAGRGQSAKVLRDAPPFTTKAVEAIDHWRFMPATLDGRLVESKVVPVSCFRRPVSRWPW